MREPHPALQELLEGFGGQAGAVQREREVQVHDRVHEVIHLTNTTARGTQQATLSNTPSKRNSLVALDNMTVEHCTQQHSTTVLYSAIGALQ